MAETILGIDYGNSRIGLALGKKGLTLPVRIIEAKNEHHALNEISRIVIENKVKKIIMGLPLTSDKKETKKSIEIRKFAKLVKMRTKKPVVFINEFSSTKEAVKTAIEADISRKKRKTLDHLAATIILKRFYEENGYES